MKWMHLPTGNIGILVREFRNRFGDAMIIKLEDGREYFAPKNEFRLLQTNFNK